MMESFKSDRGEKTMKQEVGYKITYYNFFWSIVIVYWHWYNQFFDVNSFAVEQPVDLELMRRILSFSHNLVGPALSYYFILSGLLFYRNIDSVPLWEKIKKNIYSLGAPLVLWNLALELYSRAIYRRWGWESGRDILGVKDVILGFTIYPFNIVTWYFFALLVYLLVSPLIYVLKRNKPFMTFITIVATVCVLKIHLTGWQCEQYVYNIIVYFPLYLIGAYLGLYYKDLLLFEQYRSRVAALIGFVVTVICILIFWNHSKDMAALVAQRILAISTWALFGSNCFKIRPGIIIRFSFFLYVMHESWLISISKSLIVNRLMNYSYNLIGHIILAVGCLAFVYFLCVVSVVLLRLVLNEKLFKAISGGRVWF